jgi:cholesterol transport system auxiliary component
LLKIILTAIMAFLLAGCTVASPYVSEFRINPTILDSEVRAQTCNGKTLKVAKAFSSSALMSQNMNYGFGDYKIGSFTESQWAESPNREITSHILKTLQSAGLFKSALISNSKSRSDLVLETNIEEFTQFFSQDQKSSTVKVTISNTLIDAKTNTALRTKTFEQSEKAETLDAEGGVAALNKALSVVLTRQRDWLSGICE